MQVQGDLGSVVHSWAAISEGTALPKGRGRSSGLHLGIPASNTEGREIRLGAKMPSRRHEAELDVATPGDRKGKRQRLQRIRMTGL